MCANIYKQLVAKVEELDYIVGPGMRFNVKKSLDMTHRSMFSSKMNNDTDLVLENICGEIDTANPKNKLKCKEYNLSLLAEFIYGLEEQTFKLFTPGVSDPLALYLPKTDSVEYVHQDTSGKKYIQLTELGVKVFKDTWNSGRNFCRTNSEIPISQLRREGFNITSETLDLVKKNSGSSVLAQNKYGSIGIDETLPDKSVIGSRDSIKGNYLIK